jgi:hypothetical protein
MRELNSNAVEFAAAGTRDDMADSKQELSPGARIAIGAAMFLLGVGIAARSADMLMHEAAKLASEGMIMLPVGFAFAFGGMLLALPLRFVRTRTFVGALMVTAFALTVSWIAFGPGERRFAGGLGGHGTGSPIGEGLGRAVFGFAAILLNILALLMWVRGIRRHWMPSPEDEAALAALREKK